MNTAAGAIALLMSLALSASPAFAGAGPSGHAKCADEGDVCDRGPGATGGEALAAQSIYAVSASGQRLDTKRMQSHLIKVFGTIDPISDGNDRRHNGAMEPAIHNMSPLPSSGVLIGIGERAQVRNGRIVIKRLADAMGAMSPCEPVPAGGRDDGLMDSWPVAPESPFVAVPSHAWMEHAADSDTARIDVLRATGNDQPKACHDGASEDVQWGWAKSPSSKTCWNCMKAASWWV